MRRVCELPSSKCGPCRAALADGRYESDTSVLIFVNVRPRGGLQGLCVASTDFKERNRKESPPIARPVLRSV